MHNNAAAQEKIGCEKRSRTRMFKNLDKVKSAIGRVSGESELRAPMANLRKKGFGDNTN
jgi:hypothetical protein